MKQILFAAVCILPFSFPEGFAQSPSAQSGAAATVSAAPAAASAAAAVKEEPKAVSVPAIVKKEQPKPAQVQNSPVINDQTSLTLSEFSEGDFRSMRIPGFVPDKKNLAEAKTVSAPAAPESAPDPGKSKRRATYLVWGTLIAMILVVVFLVRYSKKKRHRRVFRSIR